MDEDININCNDYKTIKYFRENSFVFSVCFKNGNKSKLPLNCMIISKLLHLHLIGSVGIAVFDQLSTMNMSNLLCFEMVNIDVIDNDDFGEILSKIFKRCQNLLCFKFEAKESKIMNKTDMMNIKRIDFPLCLQWISLSRFTNYFQCDLSENRNILGLHVRDKVFCSESIIWPKTGLIQFLSLESFCGFTSFYIDSWNEYISNNKNKLNIRFIKAVKYRNQIQIDGGHCSETFTLNINESNVENIKKSMNFNNKMLRFWTIQSWAKHQDRFNAFGQTQNPYLLTPIYFAEDKAIDQERLFQIILKISHLDYKKYYKIYDKFFRLKTIKWVGTFGRTKY